MSAPSLNETLAANLEELKSQKTAAINERIQKLESSNESVRMEAVRSEIRNIRDMHRNRLFGALEKLSQKG